MVTLLADLYIDQVPDAYPLQVDVVNEHVKFCRMSRDSYRKSPFLDHRIVTEPGKVPAVRFQEVPEVSDLPAMAPVNFIFHHAFCCSTLLTRYLDLIKNVFVLREPNSLYELASHARFSGTNLLNPIDPAILDRLLDYISVLLSRTYPGCERVVIKPTDGCNNLVPYLMERNAGHRAVLLYSSLDRFLTSIFRIPEREEWAKIRLRELSLDKQRREGRLAYHPELLDKGQTAAMVWALHMEQFHEYRTIFDERLLLVDSQSLIDDPVTTLSSVIRHFQLSITEEELSELVVHSSLSSHSKAIHEKYSSTTRENDYNQTLIKYIQEINSAKNWLSTLYTFSFSGF